MKQEERQQFGERVATALRARSAREDDTAVVKAKAWMKLNGGFHTDTYAVLTPVALIQLPQEQLQVG